MRAGVVRRHAHDLDGFAFPERRDDLRSQTLRLERETDFVFQVVIPAQRLLIRSGIDDSFVVDSVFPDRVFLGLFIALLPGCGAPRCVRSAAGGRSRIC